LPWEICKGWRDGCIIATVLTKGVMHKHVLQGVPGCVAVEDLQRVERWVH